ncbi:uncharacterized protein BDZ99DRAFT_520189 [Mytilinidion resinicola]|uniref:Uncharacterized protein n=1 Tax=Mytilinidion resinicola TaxID=574789 RepID=A0A6A6YQD9_9PEZI|nr:uncharacterized protein BDZ99DRAFT_520189 [Mytilinidion resinicola]KAF2810097.1 hypothetical protein BDZ99DRAFT_520189 [Mytilinidion resinicola]
MVFCTARRGSLGGSKSGRGRNEAQVPAKRKREEHSQSSTPTSARAKRLQEAPDAPCPTNTNAQKIIPDSEEWQFWLKFVCREHLQDDMFKEAVQGLLKICFPSGVLDEIGVDVIESQMLDRGATLDQTKAMREVAQEEVVHRLSWLLAEQLDTPHKAPIAIRTIVTRSLRIHGTELDQGMFDDLVADFGNLRGDHARVNGGTAIEPLRRSESLEQTPQTNPMDIEISNYANSEQKLSWDVDDVAELSLSEILERF